MQQKNEHKLASWYNLYQNNNLIDFSFEHFVREIDNLFPNNSFYTRPNSTVYGIEFNSLDQYGFGNLNIYTLLNLADIFDATHNKSGLFRKKARILFATSDESIFPANLGQYLTSYLKDKKHFVYGFNVSQINQFVFQAAINSLDIDYAFYLNFNPCNNKYYLQIYSGKGLISLDEQEELITQLYQWKKHFIFPNNHELITLNINKVIDSNIKKVLARYVNRENKLDYYASLSVYLMVEDDSASYILERFFNQVNIKYSKLNPMLNKDLLSPSPIVFWRWLRTANYKADLIIILNKYNDLKLITRTKEGYVTLNDDEIAFLYINSQYLYWKQKGLLENEQIFIPMNAADFIISNLENYKIQYKFENELSNANNVLFAYGQGFSNSLEMNLNYDNLEFLFNFCFMLLNYKENNNLFTFKYKKMTEASHFTSLNTYSAKKNVAEMQVLFDYLIANPDALGKYKIEKLRAINYDSNKYQYLFNLRLKTKHNKNNIYVSLKKSTNQVEFKFETNINLYKINHFIEKWYTIYIQKKIVKKLTYLVNKLNKSKKK
ncbi:MAG5620 family putative phospho-sugar mutase [Mycoplasma sp. VS424B]|uniref:MAG5620 family putative phospho-sugar mutase n=1 Tax=unclassified Mycoplasma TaxID=2683645 RepID=UPI003AAD7B08